MVDFGSTIFEGALTPEVAQQSPVQDNSGAILAESLGGAFQTAGKLAGGYIKSQMEAPGIAALNNYRMEVARINRAVQQGSMKSREAQMRLGELYTSTLSAHPGLGEDLDGLNTKLLSSTGIGSLINTGNEEEQLQRKVYEDAVTNFWVDPNADEATQNEQMGDMARAKMASNRVKVLQDRLSGIQASNGIITEQQKFEADQAIKELSSAGMTVATNRVNAAIQASYQPGANKAQIVSDLRASINTELANIGLTSLGGDYKYIEDAYTRLLNVAEDKILGKTTAEVADAEIKRIKANANLAILADPRRAKFIAASELLGHGPVVEAMMNQEAVRLFGDLISGEVDPTTGRPSKSADLVGNEQEIRTATKAFTDGLEAKIKTGPLSEQAAAEAQTGYINMLRNWSERANEANTAVDFVPLVEALANSAVGDIAVNAGGVPADTRVTALEAMRQYYGEELIPLVREQINSDPSVTVFPGGQQSHLTSPLNLDGETTIQQNNAIEMIWNGAGVEFVPTPEFASNPTIRARVRALNEGSNSVAGPLNTYIRAMAHANGDKNYEKVWTEEIMPRVFPEMAQKGGPKTETTKPTSNTEQSSMDLIDPLASNPQALTLADFNLEQATSAIQSSEAANPRKMVNATSPIEAAQAYLGFRESNTEEAKVLSAFFKEAAGIKLNPAKTAWCAAFVDSVLRSTGGEGTGKLNARSYLNWGVPVDKPKVGDVVVFSRGDPNGWQGHVGFYMGTNPDGTIKVLGGNQSDSVSIDNYDASKLLGYRRAS